MTIVPNLGENHPDTLSSLNHIAFAYQMNRQLPEAIQYYEKCLLKRRIVFGFYHPRTLVSSSILAEMYVNQVEYGKAEELFQICLIHEKNILGENHPERIMTLYRYGWMKYQQQEYQIAEEYLDICFHKRKEFLFPMNLAHPQIMKCFLLQCECLLFMMNYEKLIDIIQEYFPQLVEILLKYEAETGGGGGGGGGERAGTAKEKGKQKKDLLESLTKLKIFLSKAFAGKEDYSRAIDELQSWYVERGSSLDHDVNQQHLLVEELLQLIEEYKGNK
jgi:tetratricopeptide (TPR) repeat protein